MFQKVKIQDDSTKYSYTIETQMITS